MEEMEEWDVDDEWRLKKGRGVRVGEELVRWEVRGVLKKVWKEWFWMVEDMFMMAVLKV